MLTLDYLDTDKKEISSGKVYIETYGCQMNLNDTEIVASVLSSAGYSMTDDINRAEVILINTCSVRENAESRIFKRVENLKHLKRTNKNLTVGILGCMAERMQERLIEETDLVKVVVGPDEYRNLPALLSKANSGDLGIGVELSKVETYDDIVPLRTNGISAWISIMRGCNHFCSYCVVPYTRGRERSRPMSSIIDEVKRLRDSGIMEITFLGQNVNSYRSPEKDGKFPDLLSTAAIEAPNVRFRFVTSHPRDMSDRLIETIAGYRNICKYIHLPVQSGSDRVLELMNRRYTAAHYMSRIKKIRELMPLASLSTDIITGFPTETEDDHRATLDMMKQVSYDGAYMFKYSPREGTSAYTTPDDIPEEIKQRRLSEIILQQNITSKRLNDQEIGRIHNILIEGPSKRNSSEWMGRTDTNKVAIFPYNQDCCRIGEILSVKINSATSATLFGEIIYA